MSLVLLDSDGPVRLLTLNAPERRNALDWPLLDELAEAVRTVAADDDARALVVTGAGKGFCAGANLANLFGDLDRPTDQMRDHLMSVYASFLGLRDLSIPTIAAVNGAALGAGLGLVTACDIIVASERAVFGLPEVDVGLMGGGKHAARIIPHSLARRMMLTGYRATAEEMYRRGIIEAALPHDELMPFVMEMAHNIASKSPLATRLAKDSMRTIENMTLRDGYIYEQGNTAKLAQSEDSKEAVAAFVEKRKPVFKGR